ncbi:hypothetical protein MferCBS49748_000967 [Microsporum ferrugineum]
MVEEAGVTALMGLEEGFEEHHMIDPALDVNQYQVPSVRSLIWEVDSNEGGPSKRFQDQEGSSQGLPGITRPIAALIREGGVEDKPISVRDILEHAKLDISFLDVLSWSPSICQEVKRLSTRRSAKNPKSTNSAKRSKLDPSLHQHSKLAILIGLAGQQHRTSHRSSTMHQNVVLAYKG